METGFTCFAENTLRIVASISQSAPALNPSINAQASLQSARVPSVTITSLFSSPRSVLASTVRCKLASFCIRCNSRMTALLFSCASANSALACSWAHKPYSPAKQTDTGRQLAGYLRPLPGVLWLMSPAAPSATGTTATSFVRCDEQLRDVVALAVQATMQSLKKRPATPGRLPMPASYA